MVVVNDLSQWLTRAHSGDLSDKRVVGVYVVREPSTSVAGSDKEC